MKKLIVSLFILAGVCNFAFAQNPEAEAPEATTEETATAETAETADASENNGDSEEAE